MRFDVAAAAAKVQDEEVPFVRTLHKSLAGQSLGVDHVVALQLDVEILRFVNLVGINDGRTVDQAASSDQIAVDQNRVPLRDVQIRVRQIPGNR